MILCTIFGSTGTVLQLISEINLSEMDPSDQKRILDFASGLAFALRGTIERVTNSVFLISPANVDLGAEARQQVAQDGFFNQV